MAGLSAWLGVTLAVAAWALLCLGVGAVTSLWPALLLWSLGLLAGLVYQLRQIQRLAEWFEHGSIETVPEATGHWGQIYARLYRLLRQQNSIKARLRDALDRFALAADSIPDGIAVLSEGELLEWCNPAAGAHLGLDPQRDVGKPIRNIVRQPDFSAFLDAPDDTRISFRPSRQQDVILTALTVSLRDGRRMLITHDKTQEDRIAQMKSDFVANVSHELRTPITVVGGFLETFQDHPDIDPATRNRYLNLMMEQTQRMQRLVNDLLTLSRLEHGEKPKAERCVPMAALLPLLRSEGESLSQGQHQIELEANCALSILGHEDELHSAFSNLISNAVRYTPAGGKIVLRWQPMGDGAQFSVTDSGPGIEAQHLSRLSERFYRVDRGRSRASGGTGLGLAIVKQVALRHDAQLDIKSSPGCGSTFSIQFPARRVTASAPPTPLPEIAP